MSMSDHLATGGTRIFCQESLILLENGKTEFFCFIKVGEAANISKTCHLIRVGAAWHTVLNCCTMCGAEQPRERP